jgi:hypothetical protein
MVVVVVVIVVVVVVVVLVVVVVVVVVVWWRPHLHSHHRIVPREHKNVGQHCSRVTSTLASSVSVF